MRGGFMRPNPYNDRLIHNPVYEPFWNAAEEYDFSIGFHEGGSSGMPTVGIDRFEGRAAKHIISHTMEMMLACLSMIWGGVVERHPKLRVGFLESGGGWVAPVVRFSVIWQSLAGLPFTRIRPDTGYTFCNRRLSPHAASQ